MNVTSTAFAAGDRIPPQFTCDGANLSPPLTIAGVPDDARSLAVIVDDPDAPSGTFVHWLAWNLPPQIGLLPAGVPQREPPKSLGDIRQGTNDFGDIGYSGPCPPHGDHRYRFQVFALDAILDVASNAKRDELERAMQGHSLADAMLTGVYGR